MLRIFMLRCSSFMQVKWIFKCNWYHLGTILLTVKRKYCETPLPEAASRFILRKNCSSNPTTNHKGNAQQETFTSIKFAVQSYSSKAHLCAFIHRVS